MKLITLNTWGGRAGKEKLLEFFDKNRETDIFCLQEVWNGWYDLRGKVAGGSAELENSVWELLSEIGKVLPNHKSYFRPSYYDRFGLAMFVGKGYEVIKEGEVFVYKERGYQSNLDEGDHARNIQYLTLEIENKPVNILNFHGMWKRGKTDCEDRIRQSQNIVDFISSLDGELILSGDFNLLPDTESIRIIEAVGLRNLIKEYKVASTRTSFYPRSEKFADYIFVSKGIEVEDFRVLPDEVSDHSPLVLGFK